MSILAHKQSFGYSGYGSIGEAEWAILPVALEGEGLRAKFLSYINLKLHILAKFDVKCRFWIEKHSFGCCKLYIVLDLHISGKLDVKCRF